ncbi:alkaline phosphatase D family protein [Reichenbachiella carrageenanivorans]|uniref:Alkaline phosphatase D family protein n=1 Tax=Reichenbachiella carrageenanivorans TaxID=2979869 RepID=A0ABY6D483_9BACT|nr:alkaline phosphatase D family protein [Reichenbachiella carrageenanivorans]UXX80971.1 alkaline phosphatase D family protein [Reichenbachiella carrageenanivorans]
MKRKNSSMGIAQRLFVLAVLVTVQWSPVWGGHWDFDHTNDRVWIGEEFLSTPLEDWRVSNQRVECVGNNRDMRVNVLTHLAGASGDLEVKVKMGLLNVNASRGKSGLRIALQDHTDNDIKSLCYYGKGIDVGVDRSGVLFVGEQSTRLDTQFDWSNFEIIVKATANDGLYTLNVSAKDVKERSASIVLEGIPSIKGMIALVNSFDSKPDQEGAKYWFDDLSVAGTSIQEQPENAFGPILFNMYTLSREVMKMSVQMPPIGAQDAQEVTLELKQGDTFQQIATAKILKDSRLAIFRIENWDSTSDHMYRLVYNGRIPNGTPKKYYYEGRIAHDPIDKPLVIGGLTCQHWAGYPYRPLTENLASVDPDLLFFSGDQVYEPNGGYMIEREDPTKAIVNYLGKWNMFGWAFGSLMKDRPTICIPDDHEVYQGNLWGENGKLIGLNNWKTGADQLGGFVQPVPMLDVVMKTNSAHLPDPYDPTPMQNNIPVYYSDLVYGEVSFAIIGDRVFKSGPDQVAWWEGRKDHIAFDLDDPSKLENDDLVLLGERQEEFLRMWSQDWQGAKMKSILTQTAFANVATHHGPNSQYLHGDMDSGGWPKGKRDVAVDLMRKTGSFHICGDQHLTALVQYGIDQQRDAVWSFITPAVSTGYERRFLPDRVDKPIVNRPSPEWPNTGEYQDIFGNYLYVAAVGNPIDNTKSKDRYQVAANRASGFGVITFDNQNRTIRTDAIPFLASRDHTGDLKQFAGWPKIVKQEESFGIGALYSLPILDVKGAKDAVVLITNEQGELMMSYRIKGQTFQPKVRNAGMYKVKIGDPDVDEWVTKKIKTLNGNKSSSVKFKL